MRGNYFFKWLVYFHSLMWFCLSMLIGFMNMDKVTMLWYIAITLTLLHCILVKNKLRYSRKKNQIITTLYKSRWSQLWQADRYTAAAQCRSTTDVTHRRWWGWWVENRDNNTQFVTRSLNGCLYETKHEKQVSAHSSIKCNNIDLAAVTLTKCVRL